MQFASALSTDHDLKSAAEHVCRAVGERLTDGVDLALVFVSQHYGDAYESLLQAIEERLHPKCLLGCTGESIVGTRKEVENAPAVSLWAGRLPGATITPLRLQFIATKEGGSFNGWPDELSEPWPEGAALLMLAEPFSFPADALLERLNEDRPGVPVLGGMASGAFTPQANRVFLGNQSFDNGAVAVLVHGAIRVRAVVSQGCRPIGRTFVVTKAERNIILELSGRPPLAQFQDAYLELSATDQALAQRGLHVGCAINEYQDRFERGDFLIRNVIGADRNTGAMAIGDYARVGQTVQFHIRDAASADEDLRELLAAARSPAPQGALLFTCNGRGTRLFDEPHHDATVLGDVLGDVPLTGFFAQGEIGPVGGKNFLHGFTASVALFCESSGDDKPS